MPDLFGDTGRRLHLAEGAVVLGGFAERDAGALLEAVERVAAAAPFRRMMTPGGRLMSVAMTNCGAAGWITDRRGYRYACLDPDSGAPWPAMPEVFADLGLRAAEAAGFGGFVADACLINRYSRAPGSRCIRTATSATWRRRSSRCRSACRRRFCGADRGAQIARNG